MVKEKESEVILPIRVLHIVGNMDIGGVQLMLMNYYRNINRKLVQFDFVVYGDNIGCFEEEIRDLGGNIYRITSMKVSITKYNRELRNLLKEKKDWIIHIHHNFANIYAAIQAHTSKLNTIISHSHAANSTKSIKKQLIRKYVSFILNRICDYKVACSLKSGEWLYGKKKIDNKEVVIIKNAISTNDFKYNQSIRESKRDELELEKCFVIGHVGRFSSVKNHSFILDIFNVIYKNNRKAKLILVGEGKLKEEVINKINKLGLQERVILLGKRSDINELMQAFDVLLFPSINEGLGLTVVEAQAVGLRCIVSNRIPREVEMTKLVEFVSLKESPEYWAEAVLKLSHGYKREDNTQKIKNAGYDILQQSKELENFYITAYKSAGRSYKNK